MRIKNLVLAGAMATTLTACGGGGGSGAGAIQDFVEQDLSSLAGSESIINSYSNLLSGFNSTISSNNFASLSAVMTKPDEADISKANSLLTMLDQAEVLWSQTLTLIEAQDADTKLSIYNSDDYKNAHAALLYLKNHVKPVIQKVSQGQKLTLTEFNKVASDKKAQDLIKEEKSNTVDPYVNDKKTQIEKEKKEAEDKAKDTETKKEETTKEETKEEQKQEETKEEETKEEETKEETEEETKEEESKEESKEEVKEEDPWKGVEDKKKYVGNTTPNFNSDKTVYETNEYNGSNEGFKEFKQINVSSAYARGWTGKGSIVAVADTGYDTDHKEFDGQIHSTIDKTNTGINDTGYQSGSNTYYHGSHVLGTIVAKKDGEGMHGVAFDSQAIVIKIGNGRSVDTGLAADGFVEAANSGAVVGNLSANSNYDVAFRNDTKALGDGTYYYDGDRDIDYTKNKFYNEQTTDIWKAVTDKGMIIVNSAGNQGFSVAANPGFFATVVDENGNLILGGKMLIVGGVDQNNNIYSWSNQAGHLCMNIVDNKCVDKYKVSDFYVLAPGATYSTNGDGGYQVLYGTSMAAPIVTGQIAILHQMWPHMKGENLVKLVTSTANKDVISGYDVNIHGQGVVDFDKATQPVGVLEIPVDGRTDGKTSSINNSGVSGSSSSIANLSNIKIMVLDDFDRDYYMQLGSNVVIEDRRKNSDINAMMHGQGYLPFNNSYGYFTQGGQYDLGYMNFGIFTGDGGNGDYSANIGKTFWIGNNFGLRTNVGQLNEQDTWLGNNSNGILAVGDNNTTNYGQVGVSYQLGNNVLSFDYSKGYSDINTTDNSLITGFNDVTTESYRLAYEIHKDKHNTFGWSFSLPNHITSGSMDLEVAESVNLDGTINYTTINSDLSQSHQERNFGFFYTHSPEHEMDASFNFSIEHRQDISGVEGNDGIEVGFNYVKKLALSCGIPDTGIKFLDKKLSFAKNPNCLDGNGQIKKNLYNTDVDNATKHGLVYDMKTDMFIPIKDNK